MQYEQINMWEKICYFHFKSKPLLDLPAVLGNSTPGTVLYILSTNYLFICFASKIYIYISDINPD